MRAERALHSTIRLPEFACGCQKSALRTTGSDRSMKEAAARFTQRLHGFAWETRPSSTQSLSDSRSGILDAHSVEHERDTSPMPGPTH